MTENLIANYRRIEIELELNARTLYHRQEWEAIDRVERLERALKKARTRLYSDLTPSPA